MLKKRIIPVQLLLNGRLVKTINFDAYRDVGDPVASSKVYNSQYADELIFLNIARNSADISPLIAVLEKVSTVCFMPLALGGGIRNYQDAAFLIQHGADKVILNSICYKHPALIKEIAEAFGSQAVVVAIDVKWNSEVAKYQLYSACGKKLEDISLEEHLAICTAMGAGEIFIQSIDQDGVMAGYDLNLIQHVMNLTTLPVIACGGAGHYNHMKEAFLTTDVSALAAGSLFNFTDSNLIRAKAFLSNYSLPFKIV